MYLNFTQVIIVVIILLLCFSDFRKIIKNLIKK